MATVKVEKNTYKVDSLYQWDLNQTLEVYGLSLASIPEVHFCHIDMSRAIVRQSTMDAAGVIRVEVPNSLLQKPYKLQAYVCIYEGSTFKTLYKFEIPVNARSKPADYTLEDDPEVYSFNALENQILNVLSSYGDLHDQYEEAIRMLEQATDTYDTGAAEMAAQFDAATEALTEQANEATERAANAEEAARAVQDVVADPTVVKFVEGVLQTLGGGEVVYGRIIAGSYVGTGTYKASDPCSLTFDFAPKLLIIRHSALLSVRMRIDSSDAYPIGIWVFPGDTAAVRTYNLESNTIHNGYNYYDWSDDGKTVSWYSSTSATVAHNTQNETYDYLVIG